MFKLRRLVYLAAVCVVSLAATAQTEVLYVTGPQATTVPLTTYNVNAQTAVASQVGSITVSGSSVAPLTVGGKHLIYVWDSTDVWTYRTDSNGMPQASPSQHLAFNFPHPVTSFAVDPRGNYAYAVMSWFGTGYSQSATIVLFTISQSTGELTNTGRVVATYGPNPYVYLSNFFVGSGGGRLFAYFNDNGPYTCIVGYNYYAVNQTNGSLGPREIPTYAEANCGGNGAAATTGKVTAIDSACCGAGSGLLNLTQIATGQSISCQASNYTFCGDPALFIYLDPASENLFFGDQDADLTYIGHFDFPDSEFTETGSTIPGTPALYFSPDSRLVYAVNSGDIGIYTLQSSTGTLGASSSISVGSQVNVATTTLP